MESKLVGSPTEMMILDVDSAWVCGCKQLVGICHGDDPKIIQVVYTANARLTVQLLSGECRR